MAKLTRDIIREGQIWSYNRTATPVYYEVRNIRTAAGEAICEIHKVQGFLTGKISYDTATTSKNTSYSLTFFDDPTYGWKLEKDSLKECPECGNEAAFDDNDFICRDCRGKIMTTGRLVGEIDGRMTITTFTGNKEQITFAPEGGAAFTVRREDMPQSVLTALKTFVESDD